MSDKLRILPNGMKVRGNLPDMSTVDRTVDQQLDQLQERIDKLAPQIERAQHDVEDKERALTEAKREVQSKTDAKDRAVRVRDALHYKLSHAARASYRPKQTGTGEVSSTHGSLNQPQKSVDDLRHESDKAKADANEAYDLYEQAVHACDQAFLKKVESQARLDQLVAKRQELMARRASICEERKARNFFDGTAADSQLLAVLTKIRQDGHGRRGVDRADAAELLTALGVDECWADDVKVRFEPSGICSVFVGPQKGHGHYTVGKTGRVTYARQPFAPHGRQNYLYQNGCKFDELLCTTC